MKQIIRYAIVLIVLASILALARDPAAGAAGPQSAGMQSNLATVKGYVWNDGDRDGVQDAGEGGVRNVTVRLYDKNKKLVKTARTDQNGRYEFTGITPGDYYVDIVTPGNYMISPLDQGQDEAVDSDTDPITGETAVVTLVAGENLLRWDAGLSRVAQPPGQAPGTVRPPPPEVTICQDGMASVGGVSTLEVNDLAPGYCVAAFLRNRNFGLGRIPDGAGRALADISFIRFFYQGRFVYELPDGDGDVLVCYSALPEATEFQIYFYDFYGPRSGQGGGQREWEPLETTIDGNRVCATAQTSGAYALIGQ